MFIFHFQIPEGTTNYALIPLNGPSIALTVSGKATATNSRNENGDDLIDLTSGTVLFIAANESLKMVAVKEDLLMFRAYCELVT